MRTLVDSTDHHTRLHIWDSHSEEVWWLYKHRVFVAVTSAGKLKRYSDWITPHFLEVSHNEHNKVTEIREPE